MENKNYERVCSIIVSGKELWIGTVENPVGCFCFVLFFFFATSSESLIFFFWKFLGHVKTPGYEKKKTK